MRINNHAIKLLKDSLLSYELIYSLKVVELKTLQSLFITNLINSFITLSKSLVDNSIFFIKKYNNSHQLYVYYKVFKYLTIQN